MLPVLGGKSKRDVSSLRPPVSPIKRANTGFEGMLPGLGGGPWSSTSTRPQKDIIGSVESALIGGMVKGGSAPLQMAAGLVAAFTRAETANTAHPRKATTVATATTSSEGFFTMSQGVAGNMFMSVNQANAWSAQHASNVPKGVERTVLITDLFAHGQMVVSEEKEKEMMQDFKAFLKEEIVKVDEPAETKHLSLDELIKSMGKLMGGKRDAASALAQQICSICGGPATGLRNPPLGHPRHDLGTYVSDTCSGCASHESVDVFIKEPFCTACGRKVRQNKRQCERGSGCRVQVCDECGKPGTRRFRDKWICKGGSCEVAVGKREMCEECGMQPGTQRLKGKWICYGGNCEVAAGGVQCCRPGCTGAGTKLWKHAKNGEKTCTKLGCIHHKPE